ncbi:MULTISPECIES: bifunctional DNA-formamidopyrimidine glycosylase/DNA-(apurinic or apyrimidinic site) lyase [unclassified Iodidimonas]|jgi:formamidopyrimidine-DNA glycosylase|uniref:bifunctional DNA-formamidopyrimidine glycosylase/DNA-(apurinic or apyrimidinic site) lyase n=1 Tax=unclassified Iodidimonas TaxID=2626145 RepID=UPI0024829CEF|nr:MULTISPECIES: bifunctional DNA-formamidopyrimidine glycosylase/DNA-(apurinic or apyrimidinic site) lyase [unclassified Iodidimonas]
MPELPEVETVCRGLRPVLEGAEITRLLTRREGLRRPFPLDLAQRLVGRRVAGVSRRAKYILISMDGGDASVLIVHLGMSGRVKVDLPGCDHREPGRHDHLIIQTRDGAQIMLNDARRFGLVALADAASLADHPLLGHLGPEPFSDGLDAAYLLGACQKRATSMKMLLMDQQVIAGLGNIYVSESLYRAGISPRLKAARLSRKRAEALIEALRAVLEEAILAGGSSLRDHAGINGELGTFQHGFKVYGRADEACLADDCGQSIKRIIQAGRATFYCPGCQR